MSYASIDPIIKSWVTKHNLMLYTLYHEDEVRSVEVDNKDGRRFQIWIDRPDDRGMVGVHAWDYKKRRKDYVVPISELSKCLEEAFEWCHSIGSS